LQISPDPAVARRPRKDGVEKTFLIVPVLTLLDYNGRSAQSFEERTGVSPLGAG
jgi:hypothetical protein